MTKEYNSLRENETWELVDRPENAKVLTNRWVFKVKYNQNGTVDKFKARLVARGNEQRKGVDFEEVFAPVARHEVIRTLLASAVEKKMHVHHMDVITAYVQGDLKDTIYMQQPEMFEESNEENKVCKLNKPLYGLKQAGREWNRTLDEFLMSIGLNKSPVNPCVYTDDTQRTDVIIIIYVDDILIASKDLSELLTVKEHLKKKFKINDLGKVTNILGIKVEREEDTGEIRLNQRKYIEETLKKFGMEDCKTASTPLIPNETFQNTSTVMETTASIPYRELIGALIYISNATRPDIAFAANTLSQFNGNPSNYHWRAAKHVLRYLKGTVDYAIKYSAINSKMEMYVDSDWAADENGRRSRTGFVAILAGGPISWESKKQRSVALSTMEAEYMALSEATKEVIYLRGLLSHMNLNSLVFSQTVIHCDNQSAIQLSKNDVYHRKSKHIDIRYHYTREVQQQGKVNVQFISTHNMTADMLTKSLPKIKLQRCIDSLNLKTVC